MRRQDHTILPISDPGKTEPGRRSKVYILTQFRYYFKNCPRLTVKLIKKAATKKLPRLLEYSKSMLCLFSFGNFSSQAAYSAPTIAAVSVAITSSSSVGITTTFTLESAPEISISLPRVLLASALKVTPR